MSKFFINRPIVAMVIAILTVIVGAVVIAGLPVAQFPAIAPPEVQVTGDLRRRGRPDHRAIGGDAHRTADERRRQHELHVLAQRHRQRADEPDCRFRRRHGPEYGSDPGAEPRDAGRVAASGGRHQLRRHGAEIGARAVDAGRSLFAQGHVRRTVPGELRLHQPERPAHAREGRRHRPDIRRRPVRHAPLGETRPTGQAADHRPGNRFGDPDAEHRQSRRTGGQRTDSQRAALHLLGPRAGPARLRPKSSRTSSFARTPDTGIVRVRDVARVELGSQDYSMHRAPERQAERGHRGLPVARVERRARRQRQ